MWGVKRDVEGEDGGGGEIRVVEVFKWGVVRKARLIAETGLSRF